MHDDHQARQGFIITVRPIQYSDTRSVGTCHTALSRYSGTKTNIAGQTIPF
jgi:hypothetical protein